MIYQIRRPLEYCYIVDLADHLHNQYINTLCSLMAQRLKHLEESRENDEQQPTQNIHQDIHKDFMMDEAIGQDTASSDHRMNESVDDDAGALDSDHVIEDKDFTRQPRNYQLGGTESASSMCNIRIIIEYVYTIKEELHP